MLNNKNFLFNFGNRIVNETTDKLINLYAKGLSEEDRESFYKLANKFKEKYGDNLTVSSIKVFNIKGESFYLHIKVKDCAPLLIECKRKEMKIYMSGEFSGNFKYNNIEGGEITEKILWNGLEDVYGSLYNAIDRTEEIISLDVKRRIAENLSVMARDQLSGKMEVVMLKEFKEHVHIEDIVITNFIHKVINTDYDSILCKSEDEKGVNSLLNMRTNDVWLYIAPFYRYRNTLYKTDGGYVLRTSNGINDTTESPISDYWCLSIIENDRKENEYLLILDEISNENYHNPNTCLIKTEYPLKEILPVIDINSEIGQKLAKKYSEDDTLQSFLS